MKPSKSPSITNWESSRSQFKPTDSADEAKFEGCGYSNPRFRDGDLIVSSEQLVLALDPTDGSVRHAYELPNKNARYISCSFTWNGTSLLSVIKIDHELNDYTGKATLACFDVDVQQPRWSISLGGICEGPIICDEDLCYVGTRDGYLSAYSMRDGSMVWQKDCAELFTDKDHVWADQTILDFETRVVVVVGHQSQNAPSAVVAFDKTTGDVSWSIQNEDGVAHTLVPYRDSVIGISYTGKLFSLDIETGKPNFVAQIPSSGFSKLAIDDEHLFAAGGDKSVWRFDLTKMDAEHQ